MHLKRQLKKLKNEGISIYGLYGKEDGLYSEEQISDLGFIIGKENLKYLTNCSHSVYIDQQKAFIGALVGWLK